jgi:hypothetical protein
MPGRIARSQIDAVEFTLPSSNGFCQKTALLSACKWPCVDGVVVDRRARWICPEFTCTEIDLDASQPNRWALTSTCSVFLGDRIPLVLDEVPRNLRPRPCCFESRPPAGHGRSISRVALAIDLVQHMPDCSKQYHGYEPASAPLSTLNTVSEFGQRAATATK